MSFIYKNKLINDFWHFSFDTFLYLKTFFFWISTLVEKLFTFDNLEQIYNKISELANKKHNDEINKNDIFEPATTYLFKKYKWGLVNLKKEIVILKDDFLNNHEEINSVSIYVLKAQDNNNDTNKIFNTYEKFFKELNSELECFETNDRGDLNLFFFSSQDYNKLKFLPSYLPDY